MPLQPRCSRTSPRRSILSSMAEMAAAVFPVFSPSSFRVGGEADGGHAAISSRRRFCSGACEHSKILQR